MNIQLHGSTRTELVTRTDLELFKKDLEKLKEYTNSVKIFSEREHQNTAINMSKLEKQIKDVRQTFEKQITTIYREEWSPRFSEHQQPPPLSTRVSTLEIAIAHQQRMMSQQQAMMSQQQAMMSQQNDTIARLSMENDLLRRVVTEQDCVISQRVKEITSQFQSLSWQNLNLLNYLQRSGLLSTQGLYLTVVPTSS